MKEASILPTDCQLVRVLFGEGSLGGEQAGYKALAQT